MTDERRALQSDDVNYLIWRYLQERGMGKTAVTLEREWNMPNPQALPFSHTVAKGELISLIQHGLLYDEAATLAHNAEALKRTTGDIPVQLAPRRYQFLQTKNDRKRPASSPSDADDTSRSATALDMTRKRPRIDANGTRRPPPPAPPRRKSSKTTPQTPADDSMDIDELETTREEAIQDDTEPIEEERPPTPPTTLDVGLSAGVNTEPVAETPTAETLANFVVPQSDVIHVDWDDEQLSCLHVAGGSIWKTYQVGSQPLTDLTSEPPFIPRSSSKGSFFVSAIARHHQPKRLAVAINEQNGTGDNYIQVVSGDGLSAEVEIIDRPQDNTLFLRFNESGKLLLGSSVVQITPDAPHALLNCGYLNIWDLESHAASVGSRLSEPALDGCWLSDTKFALSSNVVLGIYEILEGALQRVHHIDTTLAWDFMQFDRAASHIACISCEARYLGVLDVHTNSLRTQKASQNEDAVLTAFGYQPSGPAKHDQEQSRLIATGFTDSTIKLWDPLTLKCVKEFSMHPPTPAMAIAFSKDGTMMAFAGERRVEIWKSGADGQRIAVWEDAGSTDEDEAMKDADASLESIDSPEEPWHALSWDASGARLAYTQGSKISIIKLPT